MWQLQIMNIFKKKKDILMQHSWSAFSEKLHKINLSWLNYCYQSQYMDFTGMGGSRLVNCPAAADKPARLWSGCSLALPFFYIYCLWYLIKQIHRDIRDSNWLSMLLCFSYFSLWHLLWNKNEQSRSAE